MIKQIQPIGYDVAKYLPRDTPHQAQMKSTRCPFFRLVGSGSRGPQFFVSSVDAGPIDYKSFDTTELIVNEQKITSTTMFINSMGFEEPKTERK